MWKNMTRRAVRSSTILFVSVIVSLCCYLSHTTSPFDATNNVSFLFVCLLASCCFFSVIRMCDYQINRKNACHGLYILRLCLCHRVSSDSHRWLCQPISFISIILQSLFFLCWNCWLFIHSNIASDMSSITLHSFGVQFCCCCYYRKIQMTWEFIEHLDEVFSLLFSEATINFILLFEFVSFLSSFHRVTIKWKFVSVKSKRQPGVLFITSED